MIFLSHTIDFFPIGVIADGIEMLVQELGEVLHLLGAFQDFPQRIVHRQHGWIMTAAPNRPAQIAKLGNPAEKTGVDQVSKIAGTLF